MQFQSDMLQFVYQITSPPGAWNTRRALPTTRCIGGACVMATTDSIDKSTYHKHYYLLHKERLKARARERHTCQRDSILVQKRERYHRNRESILAKSRLYQKTHRPAIRAQRQRRVLTVQQQKSEKEWRKAYYNRHKKKIIAKNVSYHRTHPEVRKRWRQKHPEAALAHYQRRRAAKRGASCTLTRNQWRIIKETFKHCCAYCGKKGEKLTQDHITPLSKEGEHTMSNVVPACRSCNSKKGTRAPLCPVQPLLI